MSWSSDQLSSETCLSFHSEYFIDSHFVFARNLFDVSAHFKAESGVQSTRWFIQKDDSRACHQPAGDAESLLLATTQALFDRCADNGMCLGL